MSSILEEAKKRAAGGQPTGPEDTASVEGDTDMSDFTDKPAEARAERAANPPPKPAPAPKPTLFDQKVGDKPPPKPPPKKVGKAAVKGPKPKVKPGAAGAKGAPAPGELVKKPVPPLPPVWQKPKPKQPVGKLPPPPVEVAKVKPNQDPAFNKVVKAAALTVKKAKKHPKGKDEAKAAQGAAVPPANDIDAQAKANRADTMATAKPKKFDEEAFVAAVKAALAKAAPKTLNETGDVATKAGDAKGVISDKVGASKQEAAGDVDAKAKEPPDPGTATPKPVTPMAPLEIEKPGGLKASGAMPAPVPNEQIDVREGPAKVDNEMGEAGVSEDQLAKSNEPEFTGALDAKKEGEAHSAKLPGDVRKAEGAILKQAAVASANEEKKTVGEANSKIGDTIGKVGSQKNETKSKDELKRKEVADHINGIFDKTRADVDEILSGLDEKVNAEFETGEAQVRESFEKDWNNRLENYKDDRYSGWRGPFRWARDKFRGLPGEAFKRFELSRALYEKGMDQLVRRIATIVSQELTRATVRIEQGRGEVSTYVSGLKGDLAKFGEEAAKDVADKFDNLDSSVTDKFNELSDSLAKKYAESREKVNEVLEKSKAENAGLIDKAIGAIKGVIDVILKLKDLVLTVLGKIKDVIGRIIDDPIGFLKNFVAAVKAGVQRFADRIGEHLQKGLMGWLFGTLDAAGIEIPDSFSIQGIMKLVMSVLGMTWQVVRERMAKKIGEPAMAALEAGADIVKKVIVGGPSVLWEMLVEKFTEFEDMVIGEIKSFVMEKVVKAGITWLVSMLNPAAAFIKACKMIYDVVMFFVERGSQIREFVETVIDAAGDIARGGAGGVPEKIEGVLAKLLPLAISFLANLLGLGGVGDKVRSIIDKVRSPIKKAMDKVIDVVVRMTAPIWKPAKKLFEKGKKLYGKAKEKAVAAYEKGKAKVKEVGGKIKDGYNKVKEKAKATAGKVIAKGKQVWDKGKKKVKGAYDTGKKKVGEAKDKVLEFIKIKKPFDVDGEKHTLYTTGKSPDLTVASTPQTLDTHPDAAVRKWYAEYRAAYAFAQIKGPAALKAATAGPVQRIITALKAYFKKSGGQLSEGHAPGIGHIAPHRNQLDRMKKVPLWHMESEHVLPRAMSNAAFLALRQTGIPAGKADYQAQHTILIYKKAAKGKTHGEGADNALTAEFKEHLQGLLAAFHDAKGSVKGEVLVSIYRVITNLLVRHAEDAAERTKDEIADEHKLNGAQRGKPNAPADPLPADNRVDEAMERQLADVTAQLKGRLNQAADEAGLPPDDIAPQTKTMSMAGLGHTLKWDGAGQKKQAKLTMKSQEGDLIDKIDARLSLLRQATPKPSDEIDALESVRAQAQAVQDIQRWKRDPKPDEAVKNALDALGDAIQRYGSMFKKKDIGSGEADQDEAKLLAKFGMPVKNAQHAQKVCERFGIQIFVRATNPLSPERMANPDEYLPKPAYIKAKTINALDAQLGAHAGVKLADVGVVGFFQPKMPPDAETLAPEKFAALQARFHLRNAEYLEDKAKMEMKAKKGYIKIVDGKVRHAKSGKEFAGDHDIYKILDKSGVELYEAHGLEQENGEWLVEDNYRKLKKQIIDALRGGAFNAQHGALLDWKPVTDRDKAIYETIKSSGESLLKITATTISKA